LKGDIEGSDYKLIKSESEAKMERLELRLSEALSAKRAYINIQLYINIKFHIKQKTPRTCGALLLIPYVRDEPATL